MNAFAGIRPKGGQNPTPLAFFPGVCSGVICFPVGVQPPPPIFTLSGVSKGWRERLGCLEIYLTHFSMQISDVLNTRSILLAHELQNCVKTF